MADEVPSKKRLPVLQDRPESGEPPPEERPPGHWVIAAAVVTVLVWLLGAGVSNALLQRMKADAPYVLVGTNMLSLLIAAGAGGALTARFGARASRKHATYGACAAAAFGWTLALTSGLASTPIAFWFATLGLLLAVAWTGGYLGYRIAARKRAVKDV